MVIKILFTTLFPPKPSLNNPLPLSDAPRLLRTDALENRHCHPIRTNESMRLVPGCLSRPQWPARFGWVKRSMESLIRSRTKIARNRNFHHIRKNKGVCRRFVERAPEPRSMDYSRGSHSHCRQPNVTTLFFTQATYEQG